MTYTHACSQMTKRIDAAEFIAWVNKNVPSPKKIPECDWVNQTVKLREQDTNVDMCISVTDIPESAVIICPDKAGQWRVLEEGNEKKWDSLCDYLILWESAGKIFAVFIELKSTSPHYRGKSQLLWTTSMLHYLWLVFNIDNCLALSIRKPTIVSKYIEIGDKKNNRLSKRPVKHTQSPFFQDTPHKGITINYSTEKTFSMHEILTF